MTTLAKNGTSTTSTLASTLALSGGATQVSSTEYNHWTSGTDTEHVGRVTSTIAKSQLLTTAGNNTSLETGIHHNSRERELIVTFKADSSK